MTEVEQMQAKLLAFWAVLNIPDLDNLAATVVKGKEVTVSINRQAVQLPAA
jgi:hypothetical protein